MNGGTGRRTVSEDTNAERASEAESESNGQTRECDCAGSMDT